MNIVNKIKIDISNKRAENVIDAVQGDANTRAVEVSLYDGAVKWNPPNGLNIAVAFKKPDGTKGLYDTLPDGTLAITVSENAITAILAPQVLTVAGTVYAAIVLQDENLDQLSTFPFLINVAENPAEGESVSNDYYRYTSLADLNAAMDTFMAEAASEVRRGIDKIYIEHITDTASGNPLVVDVGVREGFQNVRIDGADGITSPLRIVIPGKNKFDQAAVSSYLLGSSYAGGVVTTRALADFDTDSYDVAPSVPNNNYLPAGVYTLSFKARLQSGTYSGTLRECRLYYLASGTRTAIAGTAVANPSIAADYQTYTFTFTLPVDSFVGWDLQLRTGATSAVLNITDVQINEGSAAAAYTPPVPAYSVNISPYTLGAGDYLYYKNGWMVNNGGADNPLSDSAASVLDSIVLNPGKNLVYLRGTQPTNIQYQQTLYSEATHRIFYRKTADDVSVFSKYDAEHDLCVRWKKKGGNNLFDIYQLIKIPNTGNAVSTDASAGTVLITTETDWHAPYRMRATANGNGSTSFNFTGGAHDSTGGGSGGIPTAETESLEMIADGVALPEVAAGWCDRLEFRWKNLVQGYNTGEADGFTPRYILSEMWQSVFDGYKWEQTARIVPLEEVYIIEYYGLQNSGTGYWNESAYFVGSTGNRLINSLTAAISSNDKVAQEIVRWGETDEMAMGIDKTYDIGDRSLYGGDTQKAIFTNSTTGKAYFNIIAAQTLAANSVNSLRGYYIFRPKTI